jgi:hypothetical protein
MKTMAGLYLKGDRVQMTQYAHNMVVSTIRNESGSTITRLSNEIDKKGGKDLKLSARGDSHLSNYVASRDRSVSRASLRVDGRTPSASQNTARSQDLFAKDYER